MNIEEIQSRLEEIVAENAADVAAFVNSNNDSAGARVRKRMQEAKNLCQGMRVDVQDRRKAIKEAKGKKG